MNMKPPRRKSPGCEGQCLAGLSRAGAPKTKVRGGQLCSASSCGMADERIINLADSERLLGRQVRQGIQPVLGAGHGIGFAPGESAHSSIF